MFQENKMSHTEFLEQNCFLFFSQNTYKKISILFLSGTPEK